MILESMSEPLLFRAGCQEAFFLQGSSLGPSSTYLRPHGRALGCRDTGQLELHRGGRHTGTMLAAARGASDVMGRGSSEHG
jgi:hypothetical protein